MIDQIIQCLNSSRRVLVASHENPDGDAISSLVAIGLALEIKGKTVIYFNPDPIPAVSQPHHVGCHERRRF